MHRIFLFRAVRRSRWFWSMQHFISWCNCMHVIRGYNVFFSLSRAQLVTRCRFVHQLDSSTFNQSIERHKYKSNCAARDDGYSCNTGQPTSHSIAVYCILQSQIGIFFCAVRRVCRQYWTWFNRHVLITSTKLADGFIFHLLFITQFWLSIHFSALQFHF